MPRIDEEVLAALKAVEAELDTRWPETKIEPSLDRISTLVDLLGSPQHAYPVIQVAGTNGKTSTTRMIDALLSRIGLRTGRYISPHLQLVTERISVDNTPISPERYVEIYRDVAPYVSMVDSASSIAMSKFEVLTAMAFAAFAEAPVEVGVIEVGLGGSWDATNVADARIATICPIDIDHVEYLGSEITGIAKEKAGIIKPGSIAVLAEQTPDVAKVLLERCVDVDATVARQGAEFGVVSSTLAIGGQVLSLQGLGGVYDDIFLPLHGAHQAANAALALASVEAFFGAGSTRQLDIDAVRDAFAGVRSPGRLERLRSAPTVLIDAAHNPHGARAIATTLTEEFSFRRLVGVLGILADKDARGIVGALAPVLSEIVITAPASPRAMGVDELAGLAVELMGDDRVVVEPRLDDAVATAIQLAEETDDPDQAVSGGGVLVTGSVVMAGQARSLFGKEPE